MSSDVANIENNKVKNVLTGESVEIKSFWENSNTVIIFFRRWGCTFCRLWGKELNEIAPILKKHDIRLVGIGVEEVGAKLFADRKYFDGELYYVEDRSTYQKLGFKRFNHVTILTSLLWKQSREAMSKGLWEFGGDLKGDWVQVGGALLVKPGGNVIRHFIQQGPADHLPNLDILKAFGLESEFKPETMENKSGDERVKSAGDLKTPTEVEPQST